MKKVKMKTEEAECLECEKVGVLIEITTKNGVIELFECDCGRNTCSWKRG